MTVGAKNEPFEQSAWPITISDLGKTQLATLVDTLCKEALEKNSQNAIHGLKILVDQVCRITDAFHVQLLGKIQCLLCFLSGHIQNAEDIIHAGFFDPVHHPFMQQLYREIVQKKGKVLSRDDYCHFPPSIDPIFEDGLPKSLCDYLDFHYLSKRTEKKAMNAALIAKKTKLSVQMVDYRFKKNREALSKKKASKKEKRAEKKEEPSEENDIFSFESTEYASTPDLPTIYNNPFFMCYPSPPVETSHRFPLARVPLDEPLTIQIPEDTPLYIPFF